MSKNKQFDVNILAGDGQWEHLYDEVQIIEETKMSDEERLRTAVPALLSWFSSHARILPWREQPTPYRVWVSEIMLQQTRVEAVKPYFERFMGELPDLSALAQAEEDKLLKLWEGLGYYSRVRNLNKSAKLVMEEHGGELPDDYQKLLKLPGIGSYTAGAVASIAFGRKVPAVDGNVLRVISRVLASREDISDAATKKAMEQLLGEVMPADAPGDFNQALMEVGATVCIPRGEPICDKCPFYTLCLSRRDGLTGEIPVKKAAKARRIEERTVYLVTDGVRVLVRKRPEKGLLAGLYEFPNLLGWLRENEAESRIKTWLEAAESKCTDIGRGAVAESVGDAIHIFSHVEWRMKGYLIRLPGEVLNVAEKSGQYLAVDGNELKERCAIPNAFKFYTEKIAEELDKNRN